MITAELAKRLVTERAQNPADAGMIQREKAGRAVAMTMALTATILLVLFSTFEAAKDLLIDDLTMCQSHVITIWFITALGTFSAVLVFRHSRRLNEQIFEEMSQRNLAEKALNANARFIARVTDTIPAMISYIDTDLRYQFVNRRYEDLYHLPVDRIIGKTVQELLDEEKFDKVKAKLEAALQGREVTFEFSFTDGKSGCERHIRACYIPDFDDCGEVCGLFVQNMDISELKEAEANLRAKQDQLTALAMELALVEERERRNIAGELHDQVGQALVLCKIKLGALAASMEAGQMEHLDAVTALLEGAIQDVRSVSMQLSPPLLTTVGLDAALEWLVEQIKEDFGVKIEFWGDGKPKHLREEVRTVIFQTVRELLINVAKHAKAQNALIIVSGVNGEITVVVEDDGIGFDISEQNLMKGRSGGFGLFNVRQKIEYLGGTLQVESSPGYGTRTTITAPLQLESDQRSVVNGY